MSYLVNGNFRLRYQRFLGISVSVEISHVINSFIRGMREKTEDFDIKKTTPKKKNPDFFKLFYLRLQKLTTGAKQVFLIQKKSFHLVAVCCIFRYWYR